MKRKAAVFCAYLSVIALTASSMAQAQVESITPEDFTVQPQSSAPFYTTAPLEFIVSEMSPMLNFNYEKTALQMTFAQTQGYLRYALGNDEDRRRQVIEHFSSVYGDPVESADGQLVWRVKNPHAGIPLDGYVFGDFVVIRLGQGLNGGYTFKADARQTAQADTVNPNSEGLNALRTTSASNEPVLELAVTKKPRAPQD